MQNSLMIHSKYDMISGAQHRGVTISIFGHHTFFALRLKGDQLKNYFEDGQDIDYVIEICQKLDTTIVAVVTLLAMTS